MVKKKRIELDRSVLEAMEMTREVLSLIFRQKFLLWGQKFLLWGWMDIILGPIVLQKDGSKYTKPAGLNGFEDDVARTITIKAGIVVGPEKGSEEKYPQHIRIESECEIRYPECWGWEPHSVKIRKSGPRWWELGEPRNFSVENEAGRYIVRELTDVRPSTTVQ